MKIALIFNHFEDDYSIIITNIDKEDSLGSFVGDDDYIVTTDWDGKSLVMFSRDDEYGYIEQLKNIYNKEDLEKHNKNIIKKEIQDQLKYLTEKDGYIEEIDCEGVLIDINLYDSSNHSPEEIWGLIQNKDFDKLTDIAYELYVDWIESTYIDKDSSSIYGYLDINKNEIVLGGDHTFFIYTLDEYLKEHGNEDYEDFEESFKLKSNDKYSVLREALDKLDREDNREKINVRAKIKNLRSKLRESKTDKAYISAAVKETLEWFKNSLEDGLFDAEEYEDDDSKPLDLEDILYQYTLEEATYDLPDDTKWAKDPYNYTTEEQEAFDEKVIEAALPKAKILWNKYSKTRDLVKFDK